VLPSTQMCINGPPTVSGGDRDSNNCHRSCSSASADRSAKLVDLRSNTPCNRYLAWLDNLTNLPRRLWRQLRSLRLTRRSGVYLIADREVLSVRRMDRPRLSTRVTPYHLNIGS
jgi:hypothetical protein